MIPRVIVHCRGDEAKVLLSILEDLGYKWNGDGVNPTELKATIGNYIYIYDNEFGKVLRYSNSCPTDSYIEFSTCDNIMAVLAGLPI